MEELQFRSYNGYYFIFNMLEMLNFIYTELFEIIIILKFAVVIIEV